MTMWSTTNKFNARALLMALAMSALVPVWAYPQVNGATVTGTVTDSSGAVTPDVKIVIANMATGVTWNAVTNAEGFYTIPNLRPGTYKLTASAKGFVTEVRSGIVLTVGQGLVMNLTMTVGGITQRVTVTSQAVTINLANATLGGLDNSVAIEQLPLNGRSWTDLAVLQPGVHVAQDQPPISAGDRVKRGLGLNLIISGARPQENNYLIDGINFDDYGNAGPGSVLGGNLGTDAVAEFSILTTNYDTEYGRTAGGVISAVTKSGTNRFHGSAYEFLRNDALDARNFFDPAVIPPFQRNQFGASAGGPIQKDKTFIFGDYEGIRQNLGFTTTDTVPSLAARQGNLSTGTVTVDPAAAKVLNAFIPLPNGPVTGDTGFYAFEAFQITAENFFITRFDHTFSDKDHASVTYMFDKASQSEPDEYASKLLNNPTFRQMTGLEWNHIFGPQIVNSFRAGYNRDNVASPSNATAINPATADHAYGFIPDSTIGNVVINSLTGYSGGLDVAAPLKFAWNSWQGYDDVFYTKGINFMKFGANVERIESNTTSPNFPAGQIGFNSLSDFLTNRPAFINADVPGTVTPRGTRQTIFGAYFQDDTRIRPNLTLNLGLRYEMASIITEVQGKLSNLRTLSSAFPKPFLGSPYILNPTKRNFEPRVGFAWDPFKSGKTVVGGGFGVFDVLPLPATMGSGVDGSYPFQDSAAASGSLPQGSFQIGCATACGAYLDASGSHRYYVMDFNPNRNYVFQWNFHIQRQLTPSTTAYVGYVGGHGVHMRFQADDNNMVFPTQTSQGYEWPCPSFTPTLTPQGTTIQLCNQPGTGTILNPYMGRTQMALWDGYYIYNGLEVQINKVMSHGLQVEGSYTYSNNIDNGGGSLASDPYRNSISTLLYFCGTCRRALADQNVTHDLTANYVWDIPTPASFGSPAKAILGNWEAGGILTVESGTPFTVLVSGDPLGMLTTDPYQYPNRVIGPGCANPVNPQNANDYVKLQCFAPPSSSTLLGNAGRNSVIGPGLVDMDFSLYKNIPIKRISESFNAQFRAEFFNILNRPNFTSPNDTRVIMNSDGTTNGLPTPTVFTLTNTTSREIQFAIKFIW